MSRLRRATVGVAGFVALNLALGYLRDVGIAAQFGSSDVTDAFFAGTFLPLLVQQVALVGSLIPALLPALAQVGRGGAARDVWRLTAAVAGLVTFAAVGVVALGWLLAEPLVGALAPGFAPAKLALAADLFRLSLPMLLTLGPATVAGAVLNYHDRFLAPAAAAALFNATVVAALVLGGGSLGIHSVALGMALGGAIQLLVQLPALWSLWRQTTPAQDNYATRNTQHATRSTHHAIRTVGRLAAPLLATVAVAQAVAVAQSFFASHLGEGGLSALNYAMKLNMLPMLVFAGALTTVLFPTLSRQALTTGDPAAYAASLRRGLGQVVWWTAPAAAWLIVCAAPLVRLVYERQRFSPADSAATAGVLALYALGLVPQALNILLPRAYHARQDMRTPLLVTAVGTAIYLGLAWLGAALAGVAGLALALALANGVQMALLLAGLRPALAGEWPALAGGASRAVLAAGGAGLACWALRAAAAGAGLLTGPFPVQAATVAALALTGAFIFWILDFGFWKLWPGPGESRDHAPMPTQHATRNTQHAALTDVGTTRHD
jgi:putative peptidoglycan lipid II flippase